MIEQQTLWFIISRMNWSINEVSGTFRTGAKNSIQLTLVENVTTSVKNMTELDIS